MEVEWGAKARNCMVLMRHMLCVRLVVATTYYRVEDGAGHAHTFLRQTLSRFSHLGCHTLPTSLQAYSLMWELKGLFDPDNVLNPGVILNRDPDVHIKALKPSPAASPVVNGCVGPARNLN